MLYESGENYLETILRLSAGGGRVLPVDIARELGVSKPSVTRALKVLEAHGLIENRPKDVLLTVEGRGKAETVYARHKDLTEFLALMGVSAEVARRDACRIEHYISDETAGCFKAYVNRKKNN
jgi:Mn-dependent DtxR family transcriptional regulator